MVFFQDKVFKIAHNVALLCEVWGLVFPKSKNLRLSLQKQNTINLILKDQISQNQYCAYMLSGFICQD